MEDLLGEIELRVKLEEKKKELLQKLRRREVQQAQEAQNYLKDAPSTVSTHFATRSDPPDPEKIKQRVESIKRKAWCLGETLHMDEDTAHRKKKRKFHSIPLVTPNDSSHASITLSNDENIVQVVVKRAQPESRRGAPIEYDNKGHQLLKRLGWRENSGLGRKENGMVEPLIPVVQNNQKGLGSKTKQDTQVHNFCEVCNKIIPEASWASHLNGKKHKHRVHYVQMLEQLAPHLLPEERHQLLDEDEDDENEIIFEIDVTSNDNATTVNNNNNDNTVNNNNGDNNTAGTTKGQQILAEKNVGPTTTSTVNATTTNNTSQQKFIGPVPRPGLVHISRTNHINTASPTAAQDKQVLPGPQPVVQTAQAVPATSSKPPLLAPVPLPPDGNHQWLLCDVCKIHMYPQNWDMHINGKVHQKNLKKLVAEKQIEEDKVKAHLTPETPVPVLNPPRAPNRPFRGSGQFRGRHNNPRYPARQYQNEGHYGHDGPYPPMLPGPIQPDPRFFGQPLQEDPRFLAPVAPPGTTAVVSMIRDILAQRIGSLQQQNGAKQPDPSRIFEY